MKVAGHGFTLVEVMIVVAIIGLLAAIAVPSYMKARATSRRNACINNLRQIDGGKDEYSLEYGGTNGGILSWGNVQLYVKDISNRLFCGAAKAGNRVFSNSYFIGKVGSDPYCRISPGITLNPDHSLLFKAR